MASKQGMEDRMDLPAGLKNFKILAVQNPINVNKKRLPIPIRQPFYYFES